MTLQNLSSSELRRAAKIKDKIERLHRDLNRLLGTLDHSRNASTPKSKRRATSAAARAKIGAAMKARWARRLGVKAAKPKRKLSVAARKHLAQLAKARWAKARAAGRKRL